MLGPPFRKNWANQKLYILVVLEHLMANNFSFVIKCATEEEEESE